MLADMALHRRLVDLAQLTGSGRLRRMATLAEPAAQSPVETRLRVLLVLLVLAGLPRPRAQVPLHDARGRFLGRPDLYYPAQRLGIEYDGGGHRDRLVEDDRRQNGLLGAGYRLLRFTAADLNRKPEAVVAQVRAALLSFRPGSP